MAPRKKNSFIWNHFSESQPKMGKCNYCSQVISVKASNLSNLSRHLVRKHPTIFKNNFSRERVGSPTVDVKSPSTSVQLVNSTSTSMCVNNTKSNIDSFMKSAKSMLSSKKKKIDQQLIIMIAKEYHPFHLVEEIEFKKLLHMLCPSYDLPTRKTLSENLLPQLHSKLVHDVQYKIDKAPAICLTTDGWTSRNNQSFIAVTAHYIDVESMNLNSNLLGCIEYDESHTVENLSKFLKDEIAKWNIDNKIEAVISDHAPNIILAVQLGGWRSISCFAHLLNVIVQTSIKQISTVVKKVNNIVEFFRKNPKGLNKLNDMQKQMFMPIIKLKQDVPTRWNSTYEMLNRVLQSKNAIIVTLINNNLSLSNEDWIVIEEVVPILKVFNDVTVEICSEKNVSLSKVIVYCRLLKNHIYQHLSIIGKKTVFEKQHSLENVHNLLETLLVEINKRFNNFEQNFLYAESTILDPRFKNKGFREEIHFKKAIDSLKLKIGNFKNELSINLSPTIVPTLKKTEVESITCTSYADTNSTSFWDKFDEEIASLTPENSTAAGIIELDKYLHEPIINRLENPLHWWYSRKDVYPILFKVILKRLNLVANCVPCVRVFSKAGLIQNEKRSRLSANKVSQLLFISGNYQD